MTGPCERPAPIRTGPSENATARKHLATESNGEDDVPALAGGDALRHLARALAPDHDGLSVDRLREVATRASGLVASRRLDRTSVAAVLSVAAQAAGISQTQALTVIRGAFREAMP